MALGKLESLPDLDNEMKAVMDVSIFICMNFMFISLYFADCS